MWRYTLCVALSVMCGNFYCEWHFVILCGTEYFSCGTLYKVWHFYAMAIYITCGAFCCVYHLCCVWHFLLCVALYIVCGTLYNGTFCCMRHCILYVELNTLCVTLYTTCGTYIVTPETVINFYNLFAGTTRTKRCEFSAVGR